MRFLHTSDWHLGKTLYGKKRYEEFEQFLDWLSNTIITQSIDVLLVAGDIFDTTTPSNQSQSLYYQFLCQVAQSKCRHIVIIAGNHDSPSFLNAPKEILKFLNIHVVGMTTESIEDEVITLLDDNKLPAAIICAVPYLRDKDIRLLESGDTIDDKNNKLIAGLKNHYHQVCEHAEQRRHQFNQTHKHYIPIIGMGHLFASGGKTAEGDGVRDLYVGTLAHVGTDIFPAILDYVALGHLHIPQMVSNLSHIRYSGSPIPMGFGEANHDKQVVVFSIESKQPQIETLNVPKFQELIKIKGDMQHIQATINHLVSSASHAWLEIEYTGTTFISDIRTQLEELIAQSALEIRRIKNRLIFDAVLQQERADESLDQIDELEIFKRCLVANAIADDISDDLLTLYRQTLIQMNEDIAE